MIRARRPTPAMASPLERCEMSRVAGEVEADLVACARTSTNAIVAPTNARATTYSLYTSARIAPSAPAPPTTNWIGITHRGIGVEAADSIFYSSNAIPLAMRACPAPKRTLSESDHRADKSSGHRVRNRDGHGQSPAKLVNQFNEIEHGIADRSILLERCDPGRILDLVPSVFFKCFRSLAELLGCCVEILSYP